MSKTASLSHCRLRTSLSSALTVTLTAALVALLTGCSASVDGGDEAQPVAYKDSGVGPFDVAFDNNQTYVGTFDVDIAQADGKVEFFVPAGEKRVFKLASVNSTISGCNASSSHVTLFWTPDVTKARAVALSPAQVFSIDRDQRGVLTAYFQGLEGCSHLTFKMQVDRYAPSAQIPDEFLGDWYATSPSGGYFNLTMTPQVDGTTTARLSHNCGHASESFNGLVVGSDLQASPRRFNLRVTSVGSESGGSCANALYITRSHVGHFVSCLATRAANSPSARFEIACKLDSMPNRYPSDWYSGTLHWTSN